MTGIKTTGQIISEMEDECTDCGEPSKIIHCTGIAGRSEFICDACYKILIDNADDRGNEP